MDLGNCVRSKMEVAALIQAMPGLQLCVALFTQPAFQADGFSLQQVLAAALLSVAAPLLS